jgi:tetratricopeptide (TPR) repeat protein
MTTTVGRALGSALLAGSILLALPATGATPPTATPHAAASPQASIERNDYSNAKFVEVFRSGLRHFYLREFKDAETDFQAALLIIPDNTMAISFLNAAAVQQSDLDVLTNIEEDAASGSAKNYVNHVRLGFSYMFQSLSGRDRTQDARDELNQAVSLDPDRAGAHVGLGILRFNERSANRAKTEFLLALKTDPNNVLAREYLGQLYQTDLRDPQRGLNYVIDVPNLVPTYADIQFHIGSLLYDLKQPDAAIKYLTNGLNLDVGHVGEAGQHGYTLLARIYIDERKLTEAQRVLNQAIAADVDTIYAKTLLAKIKAGDFDPSPTPNPATR